MQKVLLVTGGSRGIGAATCRLAAEQGYSVVVGYTRDRTAALQVVTDIRGIGGEAVAYQADVSQENEVSQLFAQMDTQVGRVTHLVNSAGIIGSRGRLEHTDSQTIREVMNTNYLGTVWCCREALGRMSTRHGGTGGAIVNVSSAAATLGSAGEYVWYAASKAAVDAFTLGLAREVALEGIRVNAVAPGFIATDMSPPERLERVVPGVPMQRAGTAEEVAEAILFLLSEKSAFTTGSVLRIAGGR